MSATFAHLLLLCIGFVFSVDAQAGDKVSLKYIKEMKATGLRGLDVDHIVMLAETDVSPKYVRELKSAGMRNFDTDDAIRLAQAGVTAEYVKAAKMKYTRYFDATDVLRLHKAGVSKAYLEDMQRVRSHSLRHFDEKDVIALYKANVPVEYVKETSTVGLRHFDADDAVKLHKAKLSAEFVRDAKGLGARDANAVIKLAAKTGHSTYVVRKEKPRRSSTHSHVSGMDTMSNVATVIGVVMLIGFVFFTVQKKRNLQAVQTGDDVDVRLAHFENRVNDLQDILLSIDDRLDRKLRRT